MLFSFTKYVCILRSKYACKDFGLLLRLVKGTLNVITKVDALIKS